MTTGEIERSNNYEKPKGFLTFDNEKFIEDMLLDGQALVINFKNKGLFVITGCAHAGIINTIIHAQKIMNMKKVYAILGGFHLIDATNQRLLNTIEALKSFNPEFLYSCHCTGKKAIRKLIKTFGNKCYQLKTGDIIKF